MRVALVHHSSSLTPEPFLGDLALFRERLRSSEYVIVAWDDPGVDWSSFTHILLTSQIKYVQRLEDFLQWLERLEASLPDLRMYNSPAVVRWNSSKKYLRQLQDRGVALPPTLWLETTRDLEPPRLIESLGRLAIEGGREVVIKDVVDESGATVWKCRLESTSTATPTPTLPSWGFDRVCRQLKAAEQRGGVMLQAFLPRILTEGEWSLMYFDKRFSHAVVKRPNVHAKKADRAVSDEGLTEDAPGSSETPRIEGDGWTGRGGGGDEFRVQSRYGGQFYPVAEEHVPEHLVRFGAAVIEAVPLRERLLYARVDVVMSGDGTPCLMELEVLDPFLYLTEPQHAERLYLALLQE